MNNVDYINNMYMINSMRYITNEFTILYPDIVNDIVRATKLNEFELWIKTKDSTKLICSIYTRSYRTPHFGENIKALLLSKRLTQKALARRIGTRPDIVSDYIHGRRMPNENTLREIKRALGCTDQDLF